MFASFLSEQNFHRRPRSLARSSQHHPARRTAHSHNTIKTKQKSIHPSLPAQHTKTHARSIMTPSRSLYVLFIIALLFSDVTNAWSSPFRRRRRFTNSPTIHTVNNEAMTASSVTTTATDSRLFYQNDATSAVLAIDISTTASSTLAATATTTTASTTAASKKPRAIFLPRRSPSPEDLQRRKALLDTELVVGRVAMVSALLIVSAELFANLQQQL